MIYFVKTVMDSSCVVLFCCFWGQSICENVIVSIKCDQILKVIGEYVEFIWVCLRINLVGLRWSKGLVGLRSNIRSSFLTTIEYFGHNFLLGS